MTSLPENPIHEGTFRSGVKEPGTDLRIIVKSGFSRAVPFGFFAVPRNMLWIGDIVQDSYRRDKVDMYFDLDFFEFWISKLLAFKELGVPRLYVDNEIYLTLEEFVAGCRRMPEVDREPPIKVDFEVGNVMRFCAMTEFWTMVGGPMPYHDSYTYSLFSRRIEDRRFLEVLGKEFCEDVSD